MMRSTCLCFLTTDSGDRGPEVLLGHKKTGIGLGKIVGLGGHIEPGEPSAEAAAREVEEESGIHVPAGALTELAYVTFRFPARPSWDMEVVVFESARWSGEAAETEEIRPQWFPVSDLPFDRMWDDSRHWLPRVLAGERLDAAFTYAPDCETVADASVTAVAR